MRGRRVQLRGWVHWPPWCAVAITPRTKINRFFAGMSEVEGVRRNLHVAPISHFQFFTDMHQQQLTWVDFESNHGCRQTIMATTSRAVTSTAYSQACLGCASSPCSAASLGSFAANRCAVAVTPCTKINSFFTDTNYFTPVTDRHQERLYFHSKLCILRFLSPGTRYPDG